MTNYRLPDLVRFRRPALTLIIPICAFLSHAILFARWIDDDAGISFAYAHNFISGYGIVSQRGVPPVEGYSNPLWTFVISPLFAWAPSDPAPAMKILSLAFVVGCFVLLSRTVRVLIEDERIAGPLTFCVLLLLSFNTSFVVWTTSGLENPLFAALIALTTFCCVEWYVSPTRRTTRNATIAGAAVAALALTRPDGIVFAPAFPVILLLVALTEKAFRRYTRALTLFILTAAAPVAAYILFRRLYFGSFLPNTYYAKGGPTLENLTDLVMLMGPTVGKTVELFGSVFASWGALAALLLVVAVAAAVARSSRSSVVPLIPMLIASWSDFCLLPRDWMPEYRFATPFVVMVSLVSFVVIAELTPDKRSRFTLAATVILGYCGITGAARSWQFAADPTVPFARVERDLGLRFNGYADDLGIGEATLLAPDLGGTLYFSRHRVYDLAGLCDRVMAHCVHDDDRACARDYILRIRPVFIHMHGPWTVRSGLVRSAAFRRTYVPIWETPPSAGEVPSGDYVLGTAVPSDEALSRARLRADQKNGVAPVPPIPFPRDRVRFAGQ